MRQNVHCGCKIMMIVSWTLFLFVIWLINIYEKALFVCQWAVGSGPVLIVVQLRPPSLALQIWFVGHHASAKTSPPLVNLFRCLLKEGKKKNSNSLCERVVKCSDLTIRPSDNFLLKKSSSMRMWIRSPGSSKYTCFWV